MRRRVFGLFMLLALTPALWANGPPQDQAKDKAANDNPAGTPTEQYEALAQEYQKARQDFMTEYRQAKSQEERNKLFEKYPQPAKYAARMMALADKYPQDPAAAKALAWVVTNDRLSRDVNRAFKQLTASAGAKQEQSVFMVAANSASPEAEKFLRAVMAKNPDDKQKTSAALSLAQHLLARAARAGSADPNLEQQLTGEAEKIFTQALKKGGDSQQLTQMAQRLARTGTPEATKLLRLILDKGTNKDAQGNACLALAESLKRESEQTKDQAKREELSKQSEKYYERVVKNFATVPYYGKVTLGDAATGALNELRYLGIGKVAPDITGEDIDGKPFKLSDYRGKVVLLDFWGNW